MSEELDQARLFDDHDNYARKLNVMSASTADELLKMVRQLSGPVSIKTIYASGTRHYCWFSTDFKVVVKKKTKKKKRGKLNG